MEEHYPHILWRYLGEERDGSYAYYDKTTKDAADICGASQGTSRAAKGAEPVGREERAQFSEQVRPIEEFALENWAAKNNLWISEDDFNSKYHDRKIGAGAEQEVYLKKDGLTVVKLTRDVFTAIGSNILTGSFFMHFSFQVPGIQQLTLLKKMATLL